MVLTSARAQRTNRLLAWFCVVSLTLHVAFVAAWVVTSFQGRPSVSLEQDVIKTRLVKLGKPRDEKLLPRLDAAPPPPAPVPRSEAPPKPDVPRKEPPKKPVEQAPPRETPKRSANDILKAFSEQKAAPTLDELIKRRVGEASDEGHQEGSTLGTEITGRLKADYNDLLKARVQQAFALPTTLSDDERVRLWSNLYVKVGAAGELLDASLSPASGNSAFDAAVMAAARKASPFPAPPIQLRDFYRAGVGMKVCPLSCN